jgi:hypothetical protein
MKRTLLIVAAALVVFMSGSVFTIFVGVYLSGDAAQAPAVLQPSNYGYSV